jgi:hypothetical protein
MCFEQGESDTLEAKADARGVRVPSIRRPDTERLAEVIR